MTYRCSFTCNNYPQSVFLGNDIKCKTISRLIEQFLDVYSNWSWLESWEILKDW